MPLPGRLATAALTELWRRCWNAMAQAGTDQWRAVTVRVPLTADDERQAVAGLLGRPVRSGTQATSVGLADLDEVLTRTDADWGLVAVVEAARGPLPDRRADEHARRNAVAAARRNALAIAGSHRWVERWLDDLDDGMLTRLHRRDELGLVATAARILAELPGDGLPLPVLAARATGDTKALGATTLAGLVLRGLARRSDKPVPTSAAARRRLWEAAGVVEDDLSSHVLVLGLTATGGPLGRWLTEAAGEGMPFRVTLQQLAHSPVTTRDTDTVFVCENPAVLRAAAARLGRHSPPMVCTEGHPSVACTTLLRGLAVDGGQMRYHGDFDWPGLRIAQGLIGHQDVVPWRFSSGDYTSALKSLTGERQRLQGSPTDSPWDPVLARVMAESGVVVFEEDVLDDLLDDLRATRRR